jgi:beta-galactosidase
MKRLELFAVLLLFHASSFAQSTPCQPIRTTLAGPAKYLRSTLIKVFNDYPSHTLSNVLLEWEITLNGSVAQKGKITQLTVGPKHSGMLRLPARVPPGPGEVFLNICYRLKKAASSLPAGYPVAREQWRLREYENDLSIHPAGDLSFTDDGGTFTITSAATALNLQFNKQTGWLQHFGIGAQSFVRDSSGPLSDLGQIPSSTQAPKLQLFSTSTSTDMAVVKADYLLPETRFLLHARYTINARGEMQVEQLLEVDTTQPRDDSAPQAVLKYPPLFGMTWVLPPTFDSVLYYGDAPVIDSCHNMRVGLHRLRADDTGARTNVRWWKATDMEGHGLLISADSTLLTIHHHDRQLNIDHPVTGEGVNNYHYLYKVTPQ